MYTVQVVDVYVPRIYSCTLYRLLMFMYLGYTLVHCTLYRLLMFMYLGYIYVHCTGCWCSCTWEKLSNKMKTTSTNFKTFLARGGIIKRKTAGKNIFQRWYSSFFRWKTQKCNKGNKGCIILRMGDFRWSGGKNFKNIFIFP